MAEVVDPTRSPKSGNLTMTPLLRCDRIQKHFGGFTATKGIDLEVAPREVVGVIGANGAGKTTLLNIVSGYLAPSAGSVFFAGEEVTGRTPRELTRLGIARSFQVPQLFHRLTVLDNMMLALALLTGRKRSLLRRFDDQALADAALAALRRFGLDGESASTVGSVPQGARKLLDIAMATCGRPKLVLLDEPTSGVGKEEKQELMARLADNFSAEKTTVLFIEHDMEVVSRYATRVVALYEGQVIADGSAEEVFANEMVATLIVGQDGKARKVRDAAA